MIFVLIALLLTALAVLILWWPLRRARRIPGTLADAFNEQLGEEAFRELEAEVSRGDLAATELSQAQVDARNNLGGFAPSIGPSARRYRTDQGPFAVTALTLIAAALLAFWLFGNWRSAILGIREASHHSLVMAVDRFRAHLERHPDDLAGWKVYARAEIVLGHYAKAAQAYRKLLALPKNPDRVGTLADYGETLILEHPTRFDRTEDRIFNTVLSAQPDNSKALWYGALLALAVEHDVPLAIHRFRHLLEDGPLPPAFAAIVRERIMALGGNVPVTWQPRELRVRVGWPKGLEPASRGPATLFVYVGVDRQHAPPIWVRRVTVARLPVTVVLDPRDAMLAAGEFVAGAMYRVGARLSRGGSRVMGQHDFRGSRVLPAHRLRSDPLIRVTLEPERAAARS